MRLTITQVKQQFGDFSYSLGSGGTIRIDPNWVEQNIVPVNVYGRRILINKQVAPYFEAALKELQENGFQYLINEDDLGMGGYVPRRAKRQRGGYSSSISRHAWGIAVDLNPSKYPYGTYTQQPKPLLDIMSKYGFNIILRSDPMHFEWVGTDINIYKQQPPKGDDDVPAILSTDKPVKEWRADGFYTGPNDYGDWDTWIVLSTDEYKKTSQVEVRETSSRGTKIYLVKTENAPTSKKIAYGIGDVRFHFIVKEGAPVTIAVKNERR